MELDTLIYDGDTRNAPLLFDFDADFRATHAGFPWLTVEDAQILAPRFEWFRQKRAPYLDANFVKRTLDEYQQHAVVDGEVLR